MRSLKRTLVMRYALAVGLIALMVVVIIALGFQVRLQEALFFFIVLGLLAGALGAITFWTQRTLSADLKEIGRGLEKMVVEGELDRMPQPRLAELAGLAQDIDTIATQVRDNYELLARQRDRLQTILENISVGVIVIGEDLRTGMINPVAEKVLGTTEEYALGKRFSEIHHTQAIDTAIERARRGEPFVQEVAITLPRQRVLKVRANPIRTEEGEIAGVVCLLDDITARRRLERIRRDLVANVSHELRTPVASMRAVVEALNMGAAQEPEAAERFLADLDRESRRLTDIIEDLLALSRLESGQVSRGEESIRVEDLLAETAAEKSALAAKHEVELMLKGHGADVTVTGDRELLRAALANLVDNAIKYNRPGGSVELSASGVDGGAIIRIKDTGIGIPATEQGRIFERFYRVDKARSRETGGTGLGLSIVKHVAELHGGNVALESSIGEGSTFTLTIPED